MTRVNDGIDLAFALRRSAALVEEDPDAARDVFKAAALASAPRCPGCGEAVRHRKGVEWCKDRQMSEKTLQDRIRGRAKRHGWRVAHAGRAFVGDAVTGDGHWITPMAPGWPDLTLAKAGHRVIFMELKREDGVVEPEQWEWLVLLNECGARAIVVRPSDLREGRVNAILTEGSPL